jgi:hypothetical protein
MGKDGGSDRAKGTQKAGHGMDPKLGDRGEAEEQQQQQTTPTERDTNKQQARRATTSDTTGRRPTKTSQ